ncbi:MAG TPA: pyridoxal phosphate-dependent aminotransferase [Burkholderiales bacterium]|nr:pyridoxal phosphate-dependent aminotransferase [Burkholderiales bacterium]
MRATRAQHRKVHLRLATRMGDIEPFHVMEIGRRAEELEHAGRRVVHMEIGQPDFSAPPQVIEAAVTALRSQPLGYTAALGTPALRDAITRFYADRYGIDVAPERIVVTSGASGAFLIAMGALVDPGDEWLMPDPCYPCNRHFVRMFEGVPTTIPSGPERHYQLEHADVVRQWGARTRGVMLASPSNPTGTVVPAAALEAIVAEVRARRGFALIDEIYQGLTYGGPHHPTALGLGDDLFVVNSFSKYFNMTGWRLGWLVAPTDYVREMERLAQNAYICPSAPAQAAALAAFRPDTIAVLEERRAEFMRRRDFLVPALRALGFGIPLLPEGAFYVYADCSRLTDDSERFAMEVLEHAGVAITPGRDFGKHRARAHVRFAYTRAMADLEEGVERLARLLQKS